MMVDDHIVRGLPEISGILNGGDERPAAALLNASREAVAMEAPA